MEQNFKIHKFELSSLNKNKLNLIIKFLDIKTLLTLSKSNTMFSLKTELPILLKLHNCLKNYYLMPCNIVAKTYDQIPALLKAKFDASDENILISVVNYIRTTLKPEENTNSAFEYDFYKHIIEFFTYTFNLEIIFNTRKYKNNCDLLFEKVPLINLCKLNISCRVLNDEQLDKVLLYKLF
jgi:hypothetical protein